MGDSILNDTDLIKAIKRIRFIAFDFDGVFTDNSVLVSDEGKEMVKCSRSDGLGLRKLDLVGVEYCIISTETNPVVKRRADKLKITCYQGCEDKEAILRKVLTDGGVEYNQAMFVGNDINDLPCLLSGVLPVGVGDAYPEVKEVVKFCTRRTGGHGAVREICDLVYSVQEKD